MADSQGNERHDIFLRALALPREKSKKRKKTKRKARPSSDGANDKFVWPEYALIFDTECRITPDQSLTFGVYRLCTLVGDSYQVPEEGLFYDDNLPPRELKTLQNYTHQNVSDVQCFPPIFPLHSRSEFVRRIFRPAIKERGALIVGFNLPFDLSRIAFDWPRG